MKRFPIPSLNRENMEGAHDARLFCQPARPCAQRARPRVLEISIGIIVVEGCRKGIGRSQCNSVRNMSLTKIHAATLSHYSARKGRKIENPPFRARFAHRRAAPLSAARGNSHATSELLAKRQTVHLPCQRTDKRHVCGKSGRESCHIRKSPQRQQVLRDANR